MKLILRSRLLTIVLMALATTSLAMPPLKGTFEPNYPSGVNTPSASRLNRDNPDLQGEWNCLVILIDFPDYTWENRNDSNFANDDGFYTAEHFQNMLFSEGEYAHPGSTSDFTGSMRDYYKEISYDNFSTAGVATRWYRAPENYSYYCNQDGEIGTDDDFGFGQAPNNAQGLAATAIALANEDVDFSDYDNDEDGAVDALFIIHAGPGAEEFGDAGASYIWSHKWQIEAMELDGVFISEYTMEPENGTVGVFCHEFGHALGLPDLYDTDGSSEGVGEWCLMGGGGWGYRPGDPWGSCPVHMCAWAKSRLEWMWIQNVEEDSEINLQPVENEGIAFRVWRNGQMGNEYFLLEYRERLGFDVGLTRRQHDYDLPVPLGVLITHIDENQGSNEDESHRLVDVEEASPAQMADGSWLEHLDGHRVRPADLSLYHPNRGDDGDLWPGFAAISEDSTRWTGNRVRMNFGINTIPSTSDYAGQPTLVNIYDFRRIPDDDMVCRVQISPPADPLLVLGELEISDGEAGNGVIEPGDVLSVIPHLQNLGQQTAQNVGLTLAYHGDLAVTFEPQGVVGYPNIDADMEASPNVPFTVNIPNDAPDDARIVLDGVATCADQPEFHIQLVIELRPPGEWIKFPQNPVLSGTPDTWDARGVAAIDIIEYADSLVAYYIGGSDNGIMGIGRAVSFNFGESWEKLPDPVIPEVNQAWAAGGIFALAVVQSPNGYLMMIGAGDGNEENEVVSIGKATSNDGLNWVVAENPVIGSGGWCIGIFPLGQIDLFRFGNAYICSYGGITQQGFVALGAARSLNTNNWIIDDQPTVLPTFDEASFDGFACFAPDMYFGNGSVRLTYSGLTADFVARLGLIEVIDEQNFERHIGTETGGSILEPEADGWEAGGFISGSRLLTTPDGQRMLYAVMGENGAGIGLAIASGNRSVPGGNDPIESTLPQVVEVGSAYPNPFNSQTVIPFRLGRSGQASIAMYDLSGRLVFSQMLGKLEAGAHNFTWQAGSEVGSGLYFIKVTTPNAKATGRVLLLK